MRKELYFMSFSEECFREISLPKLIYFNDDHSNSLKCTKEIADKIGCTYSLPSTWSELSQEFEAGGRFLIFHASMIGRSAHSTAAEFIDAVTTMFKFISKSCRELKIAVIIRKTTPLKLVKDLQRLAVQGIVLCYKEFSIEETATSVNAFVNGIPYWPKEILQSLPNTVKKPAKSHSIELTHRQQQVFNLIRERGASNKVIARTLGITESTVKLHVTEIFKKYGVRTRTQLAVFSQPS
jgi:DNA-binding NarL/FixJ family response regulator